MKKIDLMKIICQRIKQIRVQHVGERGQADFARLLGISSSTYHYYENSRIPPIDVLVRIAQLTKTDLNWLACGEANLAMTSKDPDQNLTPILGRTAAGVPQFWLEGQIPSSLTELQPQQFSSSQPAQLDQLADFSMTDTQQPLLIQTASAVQWGTISVTEFVFAPALRKKFRNMFALRIDGESMAPHYLHGDIVLLSPHHSAINSHPAVIQLQNQIGLTCKLYRQEHSTVYLLPVNEKYSSTSHPLQDIVWALRVLGRIRFG